MGRDELRLFYRDELVEFAALLTGLADEEWEHSTLCDGWDVTDVASHVVMWDRLLRYETTLQHPVRLLGLARHYVGARFNVASLNESLRADALSRQAIVADLLATETRHVFDQLSPGAQLAEVMIHQQDIRRALDRPRDIPAGRMVAALDGVFRLPVPSKRRARGLRLRATDVEWKHGGGEPVEGAGEALLMAIAGRPVGAGELQGSGAVALVA